MRAYLCVSSFAYDDENVYLWLVVKRLQVRSRCQQANEHNLRTSRFNKVAEYCGYYVAVDNNEKYKEEFPLITKEVVNIHPAVPLEFSE